MNLPLALGLGARSVVGFVPPPPPAPLKLAGTGLRLATAQAERLHSIKKDNT